MQSTAITPNKDRRETNSVASSFPRLDSAKNMTHKKNSTSPLTKAGIAKKKSRHLHFLSKELILVSMARV